MITTSDMRNFLTKAFSDEEITTLCFDHFRAVYENFSGGMSKGQKIQHLLEYCERGIHHVTHSMPLTGPASDRG